MKPLVRIICRPCGHVAATVARTEVDTRMHDRGRVTIPAGTVVIVSKWTQSWAPFADMKPAHRKLITRTPVDLGIRLGWTNVPCQRQGCQANLRVDLPELAAAVARAETKDKIQNIHSTGSTPV